MARMAGAQGLRQQHLERLADDLAALVAEQPLGSLVEQDDPLILADGDDRVVRDVEDAFEQLAGDEGIVRREGLGRQAAGQGPRTGIAVAHEATLPTRASNAISRKATMLAAEKPSQGEKKCPG
jgi:hypothetical protein